VKFDQCDDAHRCRLEYRRPKLHSICFLPQYQRQIIFFSERDQAKSVTHLRQQRCLDSYGKLANQIARLVEIVAKASPNFQDLIPISVRYNSDFSIRIGSIRRVKPTRNQWSITHPFLRAPNPETPKAHSRGALRNQLPNMVSTPETPLP